MAGNLLNWNNYGVLEIWEMLKDESAAIGDRQAGAWRNTATICEEQASQLEKAAAQLAETWVPTPGSAAEAFQLWIRGFTGSMRQSAEVARVNSVTITDITYQMTCARDRINSLVIDGHGYVHAEQNQWLPAGQGHIVPRPSGIPLPPDSWREMLNEQAQAIMTHTEATVIAQGNRIQMTESFTPLGTEDPVVGIGAPSGSTGGSTVARFGIPVPTLPAAPEAHASSDIERSLGHRSGDMGTLLQGGATNAAADSRIANSGVHGTPVTIGSSLVHTPVGVALAPGGVIGGRSPGASEGRTTLRPAASSGGGTTAQRAATGGFPMAPMMPPSNGVGAAGSVRSGRSSSQGRRRKDLQDPHDPWAVPKGLPAVIEPSAEPTDHDPGPGVIGLDR